MGSAWPQEPQWHDPGQDIHEVQTQRPDCLGGHWRDLRGTPDPTIEPLPVVAGNLVLEARHEAGPGPSREICTHVIDSWVSQVAFIRRASAGIDGPSRSAAGRLGQPLTTPPACTCGPRSDLDGDVSTARQRRGEARRGEVRTTFAMARYRRTRSRCPRNPPNRWGESVD